MFERSLLGLYDGMMVYNIIKEQINDHHTLKLVNIKDKYFDFDVIYNHQYQGLIELNLYGLFILNITKILPLPHIIAFIRKLDIICKITTINGIFKFRKVLLSLILYEYYQQILITKILLNKTYVNTYTSKIEIYTYNHFSFDLLYDLFRYSYLRIISINLNEYKLIRSKQKILYTYFLTDKQVNNVIKTIDLTIYNHFSNFKNYSIPFKFEMDTIKLSIDTPFVLYYCKISNISKSFN